jgi:Ice-binding-like/Autotransporter beta-domain
MPQFPALWITPVIVSVSDDRLGSSAYNALAGRPPTANLTGQNLGGLVLTPGVYNFDSSAQLTGRLTLNALGNPNAVFIFNIGSTLTTASASAVTVIGGGQGTNVFWRVGSSATLGTTTSFVGDILALTSITLNTGANIACGAALARNGAVTLDTNNISIGNVAPCTSALLPPLPPVVPPVVVPIVTVIDTAFVNNPTAFVNNPVNNPVPVPQGFLRLTTLAPDALPNALLQLTGEAGTGVAQAGTQAMNSFLSLVTNPFANNRGFGPGFGPESPLPPRPPVISKEGLYKAPAAAEPDPRSWSIWAAGYGGQNNATGDALFGIHDRSARTFGYATGLDYRVTPYTVVGFALAGGGTNYGLSDGFGGGRSDMFQSAVYSLTRYDAAYVSAALAYAWHRVSTDRNVLGTDNLTANFSANDFAGRIEGGYRFAVPGVLGLGQYGFTPYAAGQIQSFRTPSYTENGASPVGPSAFALAYEASNTTTTRSELGAWFDWSIPVDLGTSVALRSRAAWAHDHWSDPSVNAMFAALPGSNFVVTGAEPARNLLLASSGAEIWFWSGFSLTGWFDGEFAQHSTKYAGTARLRYTW